MTSKPLAAAPAWINEASRLVSAVGPALLKLVMIGFSPVSVFGGYSHAELNDLDVSINTVTVGIRVNFGGTLRDRDRSGPSFSGAESLLSVAAF